MQSDNTPPSKRRLPRHDQAMLREVLECIANLERALEICELSMGWFEALQRYRSRRQMPSRTSSAQFVAAFGVSGLLPAGVITYARDLDRAFRRVHRYDPKEHLTRGVVSAVQRANGKNSQKESREKKLDEIGRWLKRQGYKESGDKNSIIDRAMIHHKCGETDVRDAAKRAGLTRRYAKTSR